MAAGWDAILLVNRHPARRPTTRPVLRLGRLHRFFVTACTTHEALHAIFDDPPEYGVPYDDETELVPVGTASPHMLDARR